MCRVVTAPSKSGLPDCMGGRTMRLLRVRFRILMGSVSEGNVASTPMNAAYALYEVGSGALPFLWDKETKNVL